jgi:hypothetical protein
MILVFLVFDGNYNSVILLPLIFKLIKHLIIFPVYVFEV